MAPYPCVICHPLAAVDGLDVPAMTREHIADVHPSVVAACRTASDRGVPVGSAHEVTEGRASPAKLPTVGLGPRRSRAGASP